MLAEVAFTLGESLLIRVASEERPEQGGLEKTDSTQVW
jgi:hypothetical protein